MTDRRSEPDWEDRVARFVRSPKRVVLLDNARRIAKPDTTEPEDQPKETTP